MGRKSTKENKNIFQLYREDQELTREQAAVKMEFVSADRIEKIENQNALPHPDEVLAMAEAYKSPALCNYYCSHECPIGQKYIPQVETKELTQIALELLAGFNSIDKQKNRLIEICSNGRIDKDEYEDFAIIKNQLAQIGQSVSSLQLWIEKQIADGIIDKNGL